MVSSESPATSGAADVFTVTPSSAGPWHAAGRHGATSALSSFLYHGQAPPVADSDPSPSAAAAEAPPCEPSAVQPAPAAAAACPACHAKLSAIERKMERCLTCGRSTLGQAAAPARPIRVGL